MDRYYKQPTYYSKFKCIAGDCPETCCGGWSVDWKSEELEKIKRDCHSDELKQRIDSSFCFNNESNNYSVKLFDDGSCPFHNRDTGLCDIQRELGEQYLGTVCTTYPRNFIENRGQIIRWCSTSCPAVVDLLYNDENAVELENVIARDYDRLDRYSVVLDSAEAIVRDPVRKMRIELFDFYTRMLLNKDRDIETSIILTALAVKHLTDAEGKRDFDAMPKIIHDLEPQLNNPATAVSIGDIKPNYQLKFKLVNNMIVKFFGNDPRLINISALHDGKELVVEKYLTGLERFNAAFENNRYIMRNIIMNLFYDVYMPLGKLKRSLFENYAYFVLTAASIKTVGAAIGYVGEDIRDNFKLSLTEMSRCFSHSLKKADAIAEDIKQMGLTSPAHLALIIKG